MKKALLLLLTVFSVHCLSAQMADGTVLSNTITGTDVVTGENIDLFEWLDDDKTVIVDVFTTWCGPCWSFHQSGMLEDLYDQYGPDGTDVLRIVGAEADNTTTQADLEGTGPNTAGDWLEGVHYNIVDNAAWASYFNVGYYPSIFVIRPNKGVFHMYGDEYRANINDPAWWDRAIGQSDQADDMLAKLSVPTGSKCEPLEQVQVEMFNFGTNNITSASFDVDINGSASDPMEYAGDLEPFRKQVYLSTPITLPEGETSMSVTSNTINGTAIPVDDVVSGSGVMYYNPVEETSFLLRVHTDGNPEQTSGKVYDHNGQTIKSFGPFEAGDAYQTFEYHVTLPFPQDEIDCFKALVFDGNGDGMANWNGSGQMPGVEFADTQGNIIKPVIEPLEAWSILRIDNAVNAISSSNEDLATVTGLSVSPNPVIDDLFINLDLASAEAIQLIMYNNMGQRVMVRNVQAVQGAQQETVNVSNFESGIYTLQTVSETGIRSVKVVVAK